MTNTADTPSDNTRRESPDAANHHESERTVFSAEISQEVTDAVRQLSESNPAIGQLLQSNDGEEAVRDLTTVAISVVKEHHSGPTPSGRQLREYNAIFPDGANRLFTTVESEQSHRHEMEKKVYDFNMLRLKMQHDVQLSELSLKKASLDVVASRDTRAQRFAGGLSLIVLGIGAWLIQLDHVEIGATVIATNFVAIAAVFLTQRLKRSEDKEKPKTGPTPE